MGVADYGKLGHGEVVGMKIPENKIGDFAKEYFDLFTEKGGKCNHIIMYYIIMYYIINIIIIVIIIIIII